MTIEQLFFELIRVALGNADKLSHKPTDNEWKQLYDMAKKQSLVGICFAAVHRLPEDMRPPEMLYLTWMGMAAKIQQRNEVLNGYTKKALELFRKDGFECSVLKGQVIAALYRLHDNVNDDDDFTSKDSINHKPSSINLTGLRQSGDIDLWVQGGRKKLYDYSLRTFGKLEGLTYHHIHFPIWEDVEIEAHTWPSFLSSPIRNKRLQEFCKMNATNEDIPSLAFNRVFILLHCYLHFAGHGVGLRQILDYQFVLLQGFTEAEKVETLKWFDRLGMMQFAHAVMWVSKEVFGLPDKYLLCEPNEESGRFLLDEVMQTGNMGHADERVDHRQLQTALGRYLFNLKRDFRILRICPHEALWEPIASVYYNIWKLKYIKYTR